MTAVRPLRGLFASGDLPIVALAELGAAVRNKFAAMPVNGRLIREI